MSAGIISYLGSFSTSYRSKQIKNWIAFAKLQGIIVSDDYSLESCLGVAIDVRKWKMNGLPSDAFSRENAVIVYNSRRQPLMIDPQNQANKWVKSNELENKLQVSKQSDSDFVRLLENAISFGYPMLVENVGQEIDSILDPILSNQTFKNGGILYIKIGDNVIQYSKWFRLFFTTKMSNPLYTPETTTKITLINFMITQEGLEDQLLELAIEKEKPELQEMNSKLVVQAHQNT